mmetsp:Transcript_63477/g.149421  ORF Transcript_63477/g.149421 Transcript_63477/m.149421 type:complete len:292 (+) Transcript_63477:226-1101(+)
MLPCTQPAARSLKRGPETVPGYMWVVWFIVNSYLAWRLFSEGRPLLPAGEKIYLDSKPKTWKDSDLELTLPPAESRGDAVFVHHVRDVFRSEIEQAVDGYHISLHPLRQMPLLQLRRSGGSSGAVRVKMSVNKPRLTRNTFVVAADSLDCLVGHAGPCEDLSVVVNQNILDEAGAAPQAAEPRGFLHRSGYVEFETNLTGVFLLAIATGFRDVERDIAPAALAQYRGEGGCRTWAAERRGWERMLGCIRWFGCDASAPSANNATCNALRCLCTSLPGDEGGCEASSCCGAC